MQRQTGRHLLQIAAHVGTDSWGGKGIGVHEVWDQTCTPRREGSHIWHGGEERTAGERSRSQGGPPSAGKLWVRASFPMSPWHTGAIFLLG